MAVFHPTNITCPCGRTFEANLARSVNVVRNPGVRDQILSGEFHRVICPACGKVMSAERPFYFTDSGRGSVFRVQPRGYRYQHQHDAEALDGQRHACNRLLDGTRQQQLRVVYGLDELREKLVAQDAGYDDRHVELLKTLVIYEHPVLIKTTRLQLMLSEVTPSVLRFTAYHHNHDRAFELQYPRNLAEEVLNQPAAIKAWSEQSHQHAPVIHSSIRWVNFRRWTTRYSALDALRNFARMIESGRPIDLNSQEVAKMLDRLPRGSQLPGWAKKDLRTLFDYAKQNHNDRIEDRLFEVRFGVPLDDEWATNSNPDDIDTIWQLLRNVPVTNVEGNTKLTEIDLTSGGGGLYQWSGVIQIGQNELSDRERFEDVLRHEVGHAVHAQRSTVVDNWLQTQFGWQRFPGTEAGVKQWVTLMGGWQGLSAAERGEISNALIRALGPGSSWNAGPRPSFPANHPWNQSNFGPRLAFEQSGNHWYVNNSTWYRANGLAFFMNYWYREFMVVKTTALDLVAKMPSSYAAMSHFEFFAELYSLYYDLDDPQRSIIPDDVGRWLNENIGRPEPGNPAGPPPDSSPARGSGPAGGARRTRTPKVKKKVNKARGKSKAPPKRRKR